MTEVKEKRSKLTLKLKPAEGSGASVKKKEHPSSTSGVKVAIKGRRRRDGEGSFRDRSVSNRELSRRREILQRLEQDKSSETQSINTTDVLSKINKVVAKEAESAKSRREELEAQRQKEAAVLAENRRKRDERVAARRKAEEPVREERRESRRDSGINVHSILSKTVSKTKKNDFNKDKTSKIKTDSEKEKIQKDSKKTVDTNVESPKEDTYSKKKSSFKHDKRRSTNFDEESTDKKKAKKTTEAEAAFGGRKKSKKTFLMAAESGSDENVDFTPSRFKRQKRKDKNKQKAQSYEKITQEVVVPEFISVGELADRMSEKKADVIKKLFTMGMMVTANQTIDADTAELIVEEFGHKMKRVADADVENVLTDVEEEGVEKQGRMPVVTIMGHVDHGKTSLLDAIRSSNVTASESGGITQHIGASRVYLNGKREKFITFIDTPGHEAFTEMRMRGADVTDIVILVVAADDGVKEQTIEAINHTKAAGVPMIVAINKMDKPGADPSRVKNELLSHNVVSEDLGGDIMFVEVSAKERLNLDGLMETIMLQAEMLELKAVFDGNAKGAIVETRVDPKKGVITTLLVQRGTLNISDLIVVGTTSGKVKKMTDDKGKNQAKAVPSMAVEVLGLDKAPQSGEQFAVLQDEKKVRDIITYRERKLKDEKEAKASKRTLEDIFADAKTGGKKVLPVIIKADVHGSVEAIVTSLAKINSDEVEVNVIHATTGGITESDVKLAAVSNAMIIGFNVRAGGMVMDSAKNQGVEIRYYSIIYNVIDEVKAILGGMLEPIKKEEKLGQAEVRQVFKVTGVGKIAGSYVTEGTLIRNAHARILRDNIVIHDGIIKTLKRQKDDVKEVKHNFECGILFEGYNDIKVGDVVEAYKITEEARSLQ